LGRAFDYILHLRPAEWPIMTAHTALGYLLAVGWYGASRGIELLPALSGVALWVVCLNGGTLALNSAFDRDEGDIGYLRSPPPAPRHLAGAALVVMSVGQLLALLLPRAFALAYATCFALSVLYSVPPFRFKAVAGVDWLINMWGFGTITPFAGYAATGLAPPFAHAMVLLGFCPLFAALYPLTQLYQIKEDRRRGDRTLALILGTRRSLVVALWCTALGFACFVAAGLQSAWGNSAWRWSLLGVAAACWYLVLIPWVLRGPRMSAPEHQRGMYLALGAWALTDLAIVLAWGA
jgi:4-hydroxybenzoate polyprenyltransferase